jgi:hypothetical protein
MSDRKYRQPGYMDRGEERPGKPPGEKPRPKDMTFGPRPIQMAGTREVSRCAQCGALLQGLTDLGQCSKCGFELHSCKQCTHFDPASRFECRQPIPERVARKDARNSCTYFSLRVMVEKETGAARVEDARRAFENLFKKS